MQNHRDVSPSRIKPGTYCLLDTLWSHWQMTCIINLNFMNKVVLFPSPRSFSRTDSRGREIPPNCPPPASLVLCVQQASTSTRFASHVDMHCCSFSNDVVCLLWIKWNDRKEQRQKWTKKSACWYLWSSSKRCLKSVTRTLTCFMCPERLVQLATECG